MRTKNPPEEYVENLAKTLIQRFHIPDSMGEYPTSKEIYWRDGERIMNRLKAMRHETLGKIAGLCPKCLHEYVSLVLPHWEYKSGREIIIDLACITIVHKMHELLSTKAYTTHIVHSRGTLLPTR